MNTFFTEIRTRIFEYLGLIEADLVATVTQIIFYGDDDDEADDDEAVTFYLRQFPSGRRFYSVHAYGAAESCNLDRRYAADIVKWVFGGPLPDNAEIVRKTAHVPKDFPLSREGRRFESVMGGHLALV